MGNDSFFYTEVNAIFACQFQMTCICASQFDAEKRITLYSFQCKFSSQNTARKETTRTKIVQKLVIFANFWRPVPLYPIYSWVWSSVGSWCVMTDQWSSTIKAPCQDPSQAPARHQVGP